MPPREYVLEQHYFDFISISGTKADCKNFCFSFSSVFKSKGPRSLQSAGILLDPAERGKTRLTTSCPFPLLISIFLPSYPGKVPTPWQSLTGNCQARVPPPTPGVHPGPVPLRPRAERRTHWPRSDSTRQRTPETAVRLAGPGGVWD